MKCKKSITIIIATMLILLQMIIPVQAASNKYNLAAKQSGIGVNLTWSAQQNADGYNLYINTSNKGYELIGSVKSPKASVIGFNSNNTYKAKVCAYYLNNKGQKVELSYSEEIKIEYNSNITISLEKVKNLTVSQSGQYINLNWSKVSNATGYQIYVEMPGFGYMNLGSVLTENTFIKGAEVGKTYKFKVKAYSAANENTIYGDFSNEASITIKDTTKQDTELKLDKVTGVYVDEVKENKAYIGWKKVKNATGYEVWLAEGNGKFNRVKNTKRTYTAVSDLEYDTKYKVIIVAYNDEKSEKVCSPDSAKVSFTTESKYELDKVKNLEREVDENSVSLTWSKVSNADGYDIYIAEENGNFRYKKSVTRTRAVLDDLKYDTTYKVKVCAYRTVNGKQITGEYSSARTFSTEEYQKLEKVKNISSFVYDYTAYLHWDKVKNADGYEIEFTVPGLGGSIRLTADTNSKVITGIMKEDWVYTATIRAYKINSNGTYEYGPYSETKEFTGK